MKAPQRTSTPHTLRSSVRDYFTALQAELRGRRWWHAIGGGTLGRRWQPGQTEKAAQKARRQISSVLIAHGLPYLGNAPPLPDPDASVTDAVADYLHNHPGLLELMERDVFRRVESVPAVDDPDEVVVSPPAPDELPQREGNPNRMRLLAGVDFLEREQRNRSLATAGHRFVLEFEAARLRAQGLDAYAAAIEYIAVEEGDGAGYAIHSYGLDGSDRLIEVKTTRYGRETPFYVSAHEVAMARLHDTRYWIYRVFAFRDNPRLYMLRGALDRAVALEPTEYRATPR